jgi:hypothetical protein
MLQNTEIFGKTRSKEKKMGHDPNKVKFEAEVSKSLWDRYEKWAQGRGRIFNRQLFTALLKLFLGMPESYRTAALYGREETFDGDEAIHQTILESLSAAKDRQRAVRRAAPVAAIKEILDDLDESDLELLPASDALLVRRFKTLLTPEAYGRLAAEIVDDALTDKAETHGRAHASTARLPRSPKALKARASKPQRR